MYNNEFLRQLVYESGMDQFTAHKKIGLAKQISEYEDTPPSCAELELIADYFNISADSLLNRTEKATRDTILESFKYISEYPYNLVESILGKPIDWKIDKGNMKGLEWAMSTLDKNYAQILLEYFKDEKTIAEIGKIHKISRAGVQQIIYKALRFLRHPAKCRAIVDGMHSFREIDRYALKTIKQLEKRSKDLDEKEQFLNQKIEEYNKTKPANLLEPIRYIEDKLNMDIFELELSERAFNCLKRAGLNDVRDVTNLIETDPERFLNIRNFGRKTAEEVVGVIDKLLLTEDKYFKLSFGDQEENDESCQSLFTEPQQANVDSNKENIINNDNKKHTFEEQEAEKWKDIDGYCQTFTASGKVYSRPLYRISSYGRIMSDYGQGYKEMTPQTSNYGQKMIMLTGKDSGGKATSEMIGLLVAKAFVPNPNGYQFIEFKDGDPLNCRADNIEWVKLTDKQRKMYKSFEKKINRYSLEGDYIESFDSITFASEVLFKRKEVTSARSAASGISHACKYSKKFAGTQWRYDNECEESKIDPYYEERTAYYCLDKKTGTEIRRFKDLDEVAKFLGKPTSSIQANIQGCCAGRRHTAYGYSWKSGIYMVNGKGKQIDPKTLKEIEDVPEKNKCLSFDRMEQKAKEDEDKWIAETNETIEAESEDKNWKYQALLTIIDLYQRTIVKKMLMSVLLHGCVPDVLNEKDSKVSTNKYEAAFYVYLFKHSYEEVAQHMIENCSAIGEKAFSEIFDLLSVSYLDDPQMDVIRLCHTENIERVEDEKYCIDEDLGSEIETYLHENYRSSDLIVSLHYVDSSIRNEYHNLYTDSEKKTGAGLVRDLLFAGCANFANNPYFRKMFFNDEDYYNYLHWDELPLTSKYNNVNEVKLLDLNLPKYMIKSMTNVTKNCLKNRNHPETFTLGDFIEHIDMVKKEKGVGSKKYETIKAYIDHLTDAFERKAENAETSEGAL